MELQLLVVGQGVNRRHKCWSLSCHSEATYNHVSKCTVRLCFCKRPCRKTEGQNKCDRTELKRADDDSNTEILARKVFSFTVCEGLSAVMHREWCSLERQCATWDSFLGSGAGGAGGRSAGASSSKACRKLEGTKPLCPFRSPCSKKGIITWELVLTHSHCCN